MVVGPRAPTLGNWRGGEQQRVGSCRAEEKGGQIFSGVVLYGKFQQCQAAVQVEDATFAELLRFLELRPDSQWHSYYLPIRLSAGELLQNLDFRIPEPLLLTTASTTKHYLRQSRVSQ